MARAIDADAVCERCRKSGAICTGSDCEIPTMPTLTPPNEWVSVEERLPETRDDYIVFTEDAEVFLCDYIPSVGQWWNGDDLVLNGRITHWMSLPASPARRPPEGEEVLKDGN